MCLRNIARLAALEFSSAFLLSAGSLLFTLTGSIQSVATFQGQQPRPFLGPDFTVQFSLDAHPTPTVATSGATEIYQGGISYTNRGTTRSGLSALLLFGTLPPGSNSFLDGGFYTTLTAVYVPDDFFSILFEGPQIFQGSTSAPEFAPGSYVLAAPTDSNAMQYGDASTHCFCAIATIRDPVNLTITQIPEPHVFCLAGSGFVLLYCTRMLAAGRRCREGRLLRSAARISGLPITTIRRIV